MGTGFGQHALFLAELGFEVTAVDTDILAIERFSRQAKEKGLSIATKVCDVRELDSLEEEWDVVICTFVLHFLQDSEIEKAIKDLKSITKPGGLNVIAAHTIEMVADAHRKSHLFQPNELKERYTDWNIRHYWQGLGKPFISKQIGETLEKYHAELIAQKPTC